MNFMLSISICILHTICAIFQISIALIQFVHLRRQKYPTEFQDTVISEECFLTVMADESRQIQRYICFLAGRFGILLISLLIFTNSNYNFGLEESLATLLMLWTISIVHSSFALPSLWKKARKVASNASTFQVTIAFSLLYAWKLLKRGILIFFFVLFYEFISSFLTISTLFFFFVKIFGSLIGGWKVKDRRYSNDLEEPYLSPMHELCNNIGVPIDCVYFSTEASPLQQQQQPESSEEPNEEFPCSAYVYGFFKVKRLVVDQGMIQLLSVPELMAICANEMYHWKKDSNFFRFLYFYLQNLILFCFFSLVSTYKEELANLFSFHSDGIFFRILLIMPLVPVYYRITDYFFHFISFWQTHQADLYVANAVGQRKELIQALGKIYLKNNLPLAPHELYNYFNSVQPSLLSRLIRLQEASKIE